MSTIVSSRKTVGFRSPYTGSTFQAVTRDVAGREGYLSGFETTDNGVTVTIQPGKFLQRGFVAESLEVAAIAVPTGAEPWFVVGSAADDDPDTGIAISVTTSITTALSAVVLAYRNQGVWRNPAPITIASSFDRATEPGVEVGAKPSVTVDGSGNVDEQRISGGRVVGPAGFRKSLPPGATESGKSFAGTPAPAHPVALRRDTIVLRESEEATSQIRTALSAVSAPGFGTFTKTSVNTRFGYYAIPNGALADEFFAWGVGTDLRIQGGRAAEGFAEASLLTAAGSITEVWLAGQRTGDDAIVVVYAAGGNIYMASFNSSTGALVDAAVTIDAQPNAADKVRAAMDDGDLLHVVYQHDEGVDNQVYYTKRSAASGSFASTFVSPRIAAGSNTGNNDTYPDIDIDRQGRAHIVYASGSTGNDFGDLAYVVIDQNANVVTDEIYSVTSAIGKETDVEEGFVATAYTAVARARITVTPFDEPFAAMIADESGGFDQLLLFSPTFRPRLGFDIVNLPMGSEYGCDIVSDELGALHVAGMRRDSPPLVTLLHQAVEPVYAPEGRIGDSVYLSVEYAAGATSGPTDPETDWSFHQGHAGALRASVFLTTSAVGVEVAPLSTNGRLPATSARDTVLAVLDVPAEAAGTVDGDQVALFSTRPKKLSYPFLVGEGGDLSGVNSLAEAVNIANRQGGRIVVRKGDYRSLTAGVSPQLNLYSGVSIEGEDQVYLPSVEFRIGIVSQVTLDNISGNILEFTDTANTERLRDGDLINITDGTGYHRVIAKLPGSATYDARFLVTDSLPGGATPSGSLTHLLPAGNRLENLTLDAEAPAIEIIRAAAPTLRNLSFVGEFNSTSGEVVLIQDCYQPFGDNLDFSSVRLTGLSAVALRLDNNVAPVMRAFRGAENELEAIDVYTDNVKPVLADMTNLAIIESNGGSRATPMFVTNVDDGDVTGLVDDTDRHTAVGKLVKVLGAGAALHFQDDNTRSGAVRDVPLTDDTDVDGQQLPAAFGTTTPPESIFRALREPQHKQREQFGSALLSGGTPTLGTFPRVDIGAAAYFANGIQLDTGALFNSTGTSAGVTYYYYLNDTGTVTRTETFTPVSDTLALVCAATVNGGNTAFDELVDLRMFYGKAHRKGALVVGGNDEFAHFATLGGALRYLELTADEQLAHIVLADQVTVDPAELPLAVNFQTSNIKSFKLEGLGDNAGILVADGSTSDVFSFVGDVGKTLVGSTGQKNSVVIRDILIDNAQTTVPVTTGETTIRIDDGYFTDVIIENVRTMSKDGPISNFVHVDSTAIVDTMRIQGCVTEDVAVYGVFVEATVDNLLVADNEIRMDRASDTGTIGIYVGQDVKRGHVDRNFVGPGRNAANGSFHNGVLFRSTDGTNIGDIRVLRDNVLSCVGSTPPAQARGIYGRADIILPAKDGSMILEGNRIEGAWFRGIDTDDISGDAEVIIRSNVVIAATDAGIYVQGGTGEVVTGNHVREMTSGNGIFSTEGELTVANNKLSGLQGAVAAIDVGNDTATDRLCAISGNVILGLWEIGILNNNQRTTIQGNTIELDNATSGFPVGIDVVNRTDGTTLSGNTIRSTHIGIRALTDGLVVSGNTVIVRDIGTMEATACAFLFDIPSLLAACVVTGNRFQIVTETAAATDSAVVKILGNVEDCVFSGNWVGAYIDADYSGSSTGQHALYTDVVRQTISGNFFQNRGGAGKETIRLDATGGGGGLTNLIGNMFRNTNASPIYVLTSHTLETGGSASAVPTSGAPTGTNTNIGS